MPSIQLHRYLELSQQRRELERLAEDYLQERDDYRHLRTLPGVGPIIALMIIAESGDLTRFRHYRQYLSYCGLTCQRPKVVNPIVGIDCLNAAMPGYDMPIGWPPRLLSVLGRTAFATNTSAISARTATARIVAARRLPR